MIRFRNKVGISHHNHGIALDESTCHSSAGYHRQCSGNDAKLLLANVSQC